MTRLLALSSVRIGLYIAALGGYGALGGVGSSGLTLAVTGMLIAALGLAGQRPAGARALPYLLAFLSVGATTLGAGSLLRLPAAVALGDRGLVPALIAQAIAALLGGLLFGVTLYTLSRAGGLDRGRRR